MKKTIIKIIMNGIFLSILIANFICRGIELVNNGYTLELIIGSVIGFGLVIVYHILDEE
jgi:hypothetical protein